MGVPYPVQDQLGTSALVKVIGQSKGHGKRCFTMYAAESTRHHVMLRAETEFLGLLNLMQSAEIALRPMVS